MKSRIQRIDIQNFKAFRKFSLNVEGRHLLIYGGNGSGKSSLYWALYTFLQSAGKPRGGIAKYFDPGNKQCLLNIHEQAEAQPTQGEIAITLRDWTNGNDTTYRIGKDAHGTWNQALLRKGDLASDFITYRFFFGFSHFRNSETFDLWPLFEKEILPFCVSTSGLNVQQMWDDIKSGEPNRTDARGRGGRNNYEKFAVATHLFAQVLPGIIDSISMQAQKFYDEHFAEGDSQALRLRLGLAKPPSFTGTNQGNSNFIRPVLELAIQLGGQTIHRPQTFLNEAKLTQLALSVRFAASQVNLHESNLRLLVLDDLLVSLDMSNRMKLAEILLSDPFKDYQKIILTHELGFFREFQRCIASDHTEWCFLRLQGSASTEVKTTTDKNNIEKAEEHLRGFNLDEAALSLRKAAETTVEKYLGRNNTVDPSDEFRSLKKMLQSARKNVYGQIPTELYHRVLRDIPAQHLELLVANSNTDILSNPALTDLEKQKLMAGRATLKRLLTVEHIERFRQIALIDAVIACTARVLNPSAHAGDPPLYELEIAKALDLIRKLENALAAN